MHVFGSVFLFVAPFFLDFCIYFSILVLLRDRLDSERASLAGSARLGSQIRFEIEST